MPQQHKCENVSGKLNFMLDFYLINDDVPIPDNPDEEGTIAYAGGIDIKDFELLRKLNIIEEEIHYYQDFRWTAQQVVGKIEVLSKISHISPKYVSGMMDILIKAKETKKGLVAYCD